MDIKKLTEPLCRLCPRECGIDRKIHSGLCRTKDSLEIASYNIHFGEEPPISGQKGSGTIFFAGCNLSCVYCQNYPISQLKSAYRTITTEELADIMLKLQMRCAHNINLVTPSHFVHLICESIDMARKKGLRIPIVYNTSSYDKAEVIEYLSNYIDIYLADLKYTDDRLSKRLSGVSDYFEVATKAILSMYKTKGKLETQNGIAKKGLIVRHLILPNHPNNTKDAIRWISDNLPDIHISLMNQYFPTFKAFHHRDINRKLTHDEYKHMVSFLYKISKADGFIQEFE